MAAKRCAEFQRPSRRVPGAEDARVMSRYRTTQRELADTSRTGPHRLRSKPRLYRSLAAGIGTVCDSYGRLTLTEQIILSPFHTRGLHALSSNARTLVSGQHPGITPPVLFESAARNFFLVWTADGCAQRIAQDLVDQATVASAAPPRLAFGPVRLTRPPAHCRPHCLDIPQPRPPVTALAGRTASTCAAPASPARCLRFDHHRVQLGQERAIFFPARRTISTTLAQDRSDSSSSFVVCSRSNALAQRGPAATVAPPGAPWRARRTIASYNGLCPAGRSRRSRLRSRTASCGNLHAPALSLV